MLKYSDKNGEIKSNIKVQDFVNLLQVLEKLYQNSLGKNDELASFIRELRTILKKYNGLNGREFLHLLTESLSVYRTTEKKPKKKDLVEYTDIKNISFPELRNLISKESLSKEQLLLIGEKRFGIPKGGYRKLRKEEIRGLIESAIQNSETLDAIKREASR